MKAPALLPLLLAALGASAVAAAPAPPCPAYVRHDPGGDYTNPDDRAGLEVVEKFHFTQAVETLAHGLSGPLGSDIGYTLEHFPNHHRALAAMAKLGLRDKSAQPEGARYSIVCYFDRAIGFAPNDAKVHQLYGAWLLAAGNGDEALRQLQETVRLEPENPNANYNLGLMYVKKKQYGQARFHARKAYARDFPLPGPKNKLIAAGQWRDGDD